MENHSRYEELVLIFIELHYYFWNLQSFFRIPTVTYSADSSKNTNNFAIQKNRNPYSLGMWAPIEQIHEKAQDQKISHYCPFKDWVGPYGRLAWQKRQRCRMRDRRETRTISPEFILTLFCLLSLPCDCGLWVREYPHPLPAAAPGCRGLLHSLTILHELFMSYHLAGLPIKHSYMHYLTSYLWLSSVCDLRVGGYPHHHPHQAYCTQFMSNGTFLPSYYLLLQSF